MQIEKKNGISFNMTISLKDIIWTILFLIGGFISYKNLLESYEVHAKDNVRHVSLEERQRLIKQQTEMEMQLKEINDKLEKLIEVSK